MILQDSEKNQLKIEIPITSLDEWTKYHNALLSILRKISIDKCDPQFKDDLKVIYELLSHFQINTKDITTVIDKRQEKAIL